MNKLYKINKSHIKQTVHIKGIKSPSQINSLDTNPKFINAHIRLENQYQVGSKQLKGATVQSHYSQPSVYYAKCIWDSTRMSDSDGTSVISGNLSYHNEKNLANTL